MSLLDDLPTKSFSQNENPSNKVANVANVATSESIQAAIKTVENAIAKCKENPGVLATEEFTDAVRLIRENSEED